MDMTIEESEGEEALGSSPDCHIGTALQAARHARGEGLEAISAALKIRVHYLRALEEGWWDELPAEAYVTGFLKSYARYLGLNEAAAVRRYRKESNRVGVSPRLLFPEPIDESRIPKAPLVMLSAVLTLVGYGIWYVTLGVPRVAVDDTSIVPPHLAAFMEQGGMESAAFESMPVPPAAPALAEVKLDVSSRIAMVVPPKQGPREMVKVASRDLSVSGDWLRFTSPPSLIRSAHAGTEQENGESRIVLKAKADTWIQVEDGENNTVREGLLRAGEQYRAPEGEGITLTTSDISALEILVDGTPVQTVASAGAIKKDLPLDAERLIRAAQAGAF